MISTLIVEWFPHYILFTTHILIFSTTIPTLIVFSTHILIFSTMIYTLIVEKVNPLHDDTTAD